MFLMNQSFSASNTDSERRYNGFRSSRVESMKTSTGDLNTENEQEAVQLKYKLEDLYIQLNTLQTELKTQEDKYISESERLKTEIQRANIECEQKCCKLKTDHISQMEEIQKRYRVANFDFNKKFSLLQLQPLSNSVEDNEQNQNANEISEGTSNDQLNHEAEPSPDDLVKSGMLEDAIQRYEEKLKELLYSQSVLSIKLEDSKHQKETRLLELTLTNDKQGTSFQEEIQNLQQQMQDNAEQYETRAFALTQEIENVNRQGNKTLHKTEQKTLELQERIKEKEEFRIKMNEANSIIQRLKVKLENINDQKKHEIEYQRLVYQEQHQLMKDLFAIEQSVQRIQGEIERAKNDNNVLRAELIRRVGCRRAYSVLI